MSYLTSQSPFHLMHTTLMNIFLPISVIILVLLTIYFIQLYHQGHSSIPFMHYLPSILSHILYESNCVPPPVSLNMIYIQSLVIFYFLNQIPHLICNLSILSNPLSNPHLSPLMVFLLYVNP